MSFYNDMEQLQYYNEKNKTLLYICTLKNKNLKTKIVAFPKLTQEITQIII